MPTDPVQEGCNGRNGRNGPPTGDMTRAEAILTSVGNPQLNPPGGSMVSEATLALNFQGNAHLGPPALKIFACGACKGQKTVPILFFAQGARGLRGGRRGPTDREIKKSRPCARAHNAHTHTHARQRSRTHTEIYVRMNGDRPHLEARESTQLATHQARWVTSQGWDRFTASAAHCTGRSEGTATSCPALESM